MTTSISFNQLDSIEDDKMDNLDNYEALKSCVLAVEENNSLNRGSWNDWDDADSICKAYEIPTLSSDHADIIDRAISSNGKSLAADLWAAEKKELGQNFGGGGFPHPGAAASADASWIEKVEARHA